MLSRREIDDPAYPELDQERDEIIETQIQQKIEELEERNVDIDEAHAELFNLMLDQRASLAILNRLTRAYVQIRKNGMQVNIHSLPWIDALHRAGVSHDEIRLMVATHALGKETAEFGSGEYAYLHQMACLQDEDVWELFDTPESFVALMAGIARYLPNQILAWSSDIDYHLGRLRHPEMRTPEQMWYNRGEQRWDDQMNRIRQAGRPDGMVIYAQAVHHLTGLTDESQLETILTLSRSLQIEAASRVNLNCGLSALGCVLTGYITSMMYNLSRHDVQETLDPLRCKIEQYPELGAVAYRWFLEGARRAGNPLLFEQTNFARQVRREMVASGWHFVRMTSRQNDRTHEYELQAQLPRNDRGQLVFIKADRQSSERVREGDEVMVLAGCVEKARPFFENNNVAVYGQLFEPVAPPHNTCEKCWQGIFSSQHK